MSLLQDLTKILKEANAGYNFDDDGQLIEGQEDDYVNPEVNEDNIEYINAREDEIVSVLKSPTNLDYTNSVNKYLRLLMPRYKRRVEVEDLNRNFWVISQAIAKISEYLTKGLDIRFEIVPLPNGKNYGNIKYDNFDVKSDEFIVNNTIDWDNKGIQEKWENLIFERLGYLKHTYPNDDLVVLPVIRYDNYYHNYYRKEVYLGVYKYTKENESEQFYWFYTDNGNIVKPIISEITVDRDLELFHLNEDQSDLQFYWYFGYPDSSQSQADHQKAYVTALRAIGNFIDENNIEIDIEDAIGRALAEVHNKGYFKDHYTIVKSNGKYVWTKTEASRSTCTLGESGQTSFSNATGYYLGELSSDRSILSGIGNYNLKIKNYNLRPISPSLYEIKYMVSHSSAVNDTRGAIPVNTGTGIAKKFLRNSKINSSPTEFFNVLKAYNEDSTSGFIPYGQGKVGNTYDTYKHVQDGRKVLTQHGEDRAILDLKLDEIKTEIDPDKSIVLHVFNHALLLQKAEQGSIKGQSSDLKDVHTARLVDGSPVLQIGANKGTNDSYLVYEYDGYLTGTSSNTYYDGTHAFRGCEGPDVNTDTGINSAKSRRNNATSADYNYFKDWTYANTPLEMIVIDNGSIAAAPYNYLADSGSPPRFSGGLEKYSYGAILSIPWSSTENRCYAFEYNLFENALQDSSAFWRCNFIVNKDGNNNYFIGDESYGRWHKVYTNAEYYAKNGNPDEMIIKITNVGITFGPFLTTYLTDQNVRNNFEDLPIVDGVSVYSMGYRPVTEQEYDNYINYENDKPYDYYYNGDEPYHTSPFAPVYAYGWPAFSSSQTPHAWSSNDPSNNTLEQQTSVDDSVSVKNKITEYLNGNTGTFNSFQYKPLRTKGMNMSKRGYTASAWPYTGDAKKTFTCSDLADELNLVKTGTGIQLPYTIDLFSKQNSDHTLNEGRYLDDTQYKFYGFTTVVHTTYIKLNLKEQNSCQVAISDTRRLKVDYKPNVVNSKLRWNKQWNNNISGISNQSDLEQLIENDYTLKQSVGDFVSQEQTEGVPNKVVFNFSKYPSNGTCPIKNIDPANLYTAGTGDITNVVTVDTQPAQRPTPPVEENTPSEENPE